MHYLTGCLGLSLVQPSGLTATARVDACGNYGYSGARLGDPFGGMIQDAVSSWFPLLDAAGVVPDLVIVAGATENDIAAGISAAEINKNVLLWANVLLNKWPNCAILWATPRPDNRLSVSAALSAAAQSVYEYVMALPSTVGNRFMPWDVRRVNALGDTWNIDPARCSDADTPTFGVHPNTKGAMAEVRVAVATLRAAGYAIDEFKAKLVASNYRQVGTTSAVAGVFGAGSTAPALSQILNGTTGTAAGTTGWDTTSGANLSTAEQPGWLIKMASSGSPAAWLIRNAVLGTPATVVPRKLTPFVRLQVVSGGANIRSIAAAVQVTYSGGLSAENWTSGLVDDTVSPEYEDGEIVTLYAPLLTPKTTVFGGAGTITNIIPWLYADILANSTATVRILDCGVLATSAPATDVYAT
jgi:hypothetical protein